jgi:hypothetical protein
MKPPAESPRRPGVDPARGRVGGILVLAMIGISN